MISNRQFINIFRFHKILRIRPSIHNNYCTKNTSVGELENIEEIFFNSSVQQILKKITGLDYERIFAPSHRPLEPHKYEFVTDKQLKKLQDEAAAKANQRLQMPPVMSIRKPIEEILSVDPDLQGYLKHKLVFTDITPSISPRDRIITVREEDGTLRKANWDERARMNQIHYPLPGRNLEVPKMFESPNLERLLEAGEYKFILDCTCCQFEPDDPEYHRVTNATYEHIKSNKKFDVLRSTRHFGPMAFYFVLKKNIDPLLIDMIELQQISDAFDYIKLLYFIHKDMVMANNVDENNQMAVIKDYIKNHAALKDKLELVLQSFEERTSKTSEEVSA